jgi:hypothetical protein
MLHLPEALPDETLYSLLGRIAVVNGMTDHLRVFEKAFGHRRPTSIVRTTTGLSRFCDQTGGAYGELHSLITHFTIAPVHTHLNMFPFDESKPRKRLSAWLHGGVFDYSGNTRNEWRECPRCRSEDEERLGFSYWRRFHQLPTTYHCPIHKELLRSSIIPGAHLHDHFWLPHELSFTSMATEVVKPSVATALASIGKDALNDFSEPFNWVAIRGSFYSALRDRRLLTRTGKIKLQDCLNDFYGMLTLNEERAAITGWPIRQMLSELQKDMLNTPIQFYLLLVYWLFGTWQHFKECCKWGATFNYSIDSFQTGVKTPTHTPDGNQTLLNHYRRICVDYLYNNPIGTRAEFMKQEYRSFRWLRHNDGEWLDHHLPLSSRNNISGLFS